MAGISSVTAEIKAKSEQIAELRSDQGKLRDKQEADFRKITESLQEISNRLIQVEVITKILQASAGKKLEGASITTPEGTTHYKSEEIQKFLDDAARAAKGGKELKVRMRAYDADTQRCVVGTGGCIEVGFIDNKNDALAYKIIAHFVDPQLVGSSAKEIHPEKLAESSPRCWSQEENDTPEHNPASAADGWRRALSRHSVGIQQRR